MSSKITVGVVVLSVLAGCAPSQEDELAAANFHNVGTLDESSVGSRGNRTVMVIMKSQSPVNFTIIAMALSSPPSAFRSAMVES